MNEGRIHGFGTDLTPTCDRCGGPPAAGALMDESLTVVCFECLTAEERQAFNRGEGVTLVHEPER